MSHGSLGRIVFFGIGVLCLVPVAGCGGGGSLESEDFGDRLEALRNLEGRTDDQAIQMLVEAARHPDEKTATEAVWLLGRIHKERARQGLLGVLSEEDRDKVRHAAVASLLQMYAPDQEGKKVVVQMFRRLIQHDPSPRVRAEAAAALGRLGGFSEVQLLADVAVDDGAVVVESRCVQAIEELVGVEFGFDPSADADARRAVLLRVREIAPDIAAKYMRSERRNP